ESASISVLGISFEELGLGVAKSWGLPDNLQRCMRKLPGDPPPNGGDKNDRLRWLAQAANELTDTRRRCEPGQASAAVGAPGEHVERVSPCFKVSVKAPSDLFSAVCIKGADTLISDATVANIATRLPPWYRQTVNAPAFLLLPLMLKGAPFALIYADKAKPGA